MRTIERVYVATHKADLRLTRICIASIRHWYPELPIFLLKDEMSGCFSTRELEMKWDVRVWPTKPINFGWGFIKLEPLFSTTHTHYLVIDSDIVFIGRVIEELERFDGDFVVHDEVQPESAMRDLYFDLRELRRTVDPTFRNVPFTFNTGQYVATSGLLTRTDFESVLEWTGPPRVRYPQFFNAGEQGVLNYVLLKKRAQGALTIDGAQFMRWGEEATRLLDLTAIATCSPYPALIHWAGLKKWRVRQMLRSDILRYFEREYYARTEWGRSRLAARIIRADAERLGERLIRKGKKLASGLRAGWPMGSWRRSREMTSSSQLPFAHARESAAVAAHRYRILCIGETWRGSDAQAAFAALGRLGHEIQIIDEWHYVPVRWQSFLCRVLRKGLAPLFVRELTRKSLQSIEGFRPHCLFVFKGRWVDRRVIAAANAAGTATVNFYPDVSFTVHGPYLPRALPLYNHVFNTKSYGLADMRSRLAIENVSLLPPGYDPGLHRPIELSADERAAFHSEVAFIGTWSPKKEALLAALRTLLPNIKLRIWGCQWERRSAHCLDACVVGREVTGDEYVKAICGSMICLGLLSEVRPGASSGDLITARTFQIPACGTFMLHERNAEVSQYFEEDREVVFFSTVEEMAAKIVHYLRNREERELIAGAALERSQRDDYSIDGRLKSVIAWLDHHCNAEV